MAEKAGPYLNEHESAKSMETTAPGGYTPSEDEKKALKLVDQLFERAKHHRKGYDHKWLDNYKMFRGQQWKEARPSYRHSEVINMIFTSIQSTVPIMTDARPKIEFNPKEPSDRELADILNQVLESDWESGNWLQQLTEMIYDAHFYSVGIGGLEYDPKANYGAGAIQFQSEDPFYSFPDPNARDVNKKSKFWIHAEPVDVDILKGEYPDKAEFIKADLQDLIQGSKVNLDQMRFKSPVDNRTILEGGSSNASDIGLKNQALKITAWIKSDEYIEEEKKTVNPDTQVEESIYEQRLKYPNGRKICVTSGIVLSDGPNEFDDGLIPRIRLVNYLLPREFWGISEVEQLESPQKIFNKLVSFSLDVLTLMGNPIWVVDNDSEVDTDNLFNRPGLIVEKAKGTEVRREPGVQLQPYVMEMIDRMRSWFDGVSGANDVTKGVRPEGITAASAISELQDAAQTRLRLKSRLLDDALKDFGRMYVNRVFQFYDAPRVFRITRNENAQTYFKFHIDRTPDATGNPQKKAVVQTYVTNPDTQATELTDPKEYLIRGEFDVMVTTGSSLPFAKTQKINLAMQLFKAGAIDEPELLKASDYPNWQAVWDRVSQARQKQAQAEAAAKGGQQAPPQA